MKNKVRALEQEIARLTLVIETVRRNHLPGSHPTAREQVAELQEKLRTLLARRHELLYF